MPGRRLPDLLPWALQHRNAGAVFGGKDPGKNGSIGYSLDLLLVKMPPTAAMASATERAGDAVRRAFHEGALRAGTNWRLKAQPFVL